MTAIIREEADPLPATVPAPLRWIVEHLLAKDPSDRYESTRDLYRELRQIRDRLSESTVSGVQAASTVATPQAAPLLAESPGRSVRGSCWQSCPAPPDGCFTPPVGWENRNSLR